MTATASDTSPWKDPERIRALGTVAVLAGGTSAEREVSLRSGAAVLESLRRSGVDCVQIDPRDDVMESLVRQRPDFAFIALHGRGGEDGTMQGLLEICGIPYSGSGVLGSALAMDKWRTKQVWAQCGLPTPVSVHLREDTDWENVGADTGFPLFVKPVHEGSSIGMSRVSDAAGLRKAWADASAYDGEVMAERFVDGPEFTVAVLDGDPLPVLRLETPREFYDYEAKYETGDTRYLYPCGLEADAEREISDLAVRAFDALGCSGWGRVDIMQDSAGGFWLLEANTIPGLTDHSLVPMAAGHAGIGFDELVLRIIFAAAGRDAQ